MEKIIPELCVMFYVAGEEIKKEHQVLMVNKTTSFKNINIRRETSRMASQLSL